MAEGGDPVPPVHQNDNLGLGDRDTINRIIEIVAEETAREFEGIGMFIGHDIPGMQMLKSALEEAQMRYQMEKMRRGQWEDLAESRAEEIKTLEQGRLALETQLEEKEKENIELKKMLETLRQESGK